MPTPRRAPPFVMPADPTLPSRTPRLRSGSPHTRAATATIRRARAPQSPSTSPNSGGRMGFIEVWAQVKANSNQTAVGLFDVTGGHRRFVPGQDTLCSTTAVVPLPGDLFMTLDGVPGVYGTPMSVAACAGALGPPGPVLLRVPAGQRRFRLEYADCGCGGPGKAGVSHRWLWIRPAPTS